MKKRILINGLTLNQTIKEETRRRFTTFWGQKILLKPYICDKIIGDGMQLVWVKSIDSRPQYWLLRIDSKTNVHADDFDVEHLLEPIEEECGTWEDNEKKGGFPQFSWGGGFWGCVGNFTTDKVKQNKVFDVKK